MTPITTFINRGPHDPSYTWIVLHALPDDTEAAEVFPNYWDAADFAIRDDVEFIALIQTWYDRKEMCIKAECVKFDARAYYAGKQQEERDAASKEAAEYEAQRAADIADYHRRVL